MGKFLNYQPLLNIRQGLENSYPFPKGWPKGEWPLSGEFRPSRLEVVVGAVLVQNINWNNVEKALSRMIEKQLVEASQIEGCPPALLEDTIRSAGFYRQKARRLKGIVQRIMLEDGILDSSFQRASFLAGKQLVYLERYWKMYLPEAPLLNDPEFFQELIASTAGSPPASADDAAP